MFKMLCTTHPITQLAHTCTHESQWSHRGENSCGNEAPLPPSPFFFGKLGGGRGFKEYYIIPAMVKMTQLYSTNAETHLDRECIPEGGSGEWGCC